MIYWIDAQLPPQFPRAQELLASGEAVVEITDLEATKNV